MRKRFKQFFDNEAAGGIVLIFTAVIALLIANSPAEHAYHSFINFPVTIKLGMFGFEGSFEQFVNDAFMALFFITVAIEIKHEMIAGHLSSFKTASFPFFGALGGMVAPAIIYSIFNHSNPVLAPGWGIPMATDIAFAIGVLSLLGNRVPASIKVFLLALAVIDDLGAIVVIALFYTSNLSVAWLGLGFVGIGIMYVLNRRDVRALTPYFAIFGVVWYAFLQSGVHATIAGVLTGFVLPNRDIRGRNLAHEVSVYFSPYVKWLIIPLFAFVNSGVHIGGLGEGFAENMTVTLGIFFGLFLGKPIGIFLFTFVASKFNLTQRPNSMSWDLVFAVGIICGIGFTMSIFVANLSFPADSEADHVHLAIARLSILGSSTIAAIIGLIVTRFGLMWHENHDPKFAKVRK